MKTSLVLAIALLAAPALAQPIIIPLQQSRSEPPPPPPSPVPVAPPQAGATEVAPAARAVPAEEPPPAVPR
ncbi:MAG: hypothetical protein NVSMB18_18510 [Acetobacteraceae bacterium]